MKPKNQIKEEVKSDSSGEEEQIKGVPKIKITRLDKTLSDSKKEGYKSNKVRSMEPI